MTEKQLPFIHIDWISETHYHIETSLPEGEVVKWIEALVINLKHNIANGLLINPKIVN